MGELGLDQTDVFKKFCGSGLFGSNFFGTGLDSAKKISQTAHLWIIAHDQHWEEQKGRYFCVITATCQD